MPLLWIEPYRGYEFEPNPSLQGIREATRVDPIDRKSPEKGASKRATRAYASTREIAQPPEVQWAKDIMSAPMMTITTADTIATAQKLFEAHRFRHLGVTTEDGWLVSMLSDRDVLKASAKPEDSVASHMSERILTAGLDATIQEIASVMVHERISAIPIVDEDQQPLGIVTTTDILEHLVATSRFDISV